MDCEPISGHGDINADASCEPVNNNSDCLTEFTYVYQAIDESGNLTSVVQTIFVEDTIAPVIENCPSDVLVHCVNEIPVASAGTPSMDGSVVSWREINCSAVALLPHSSVAVYIRCRTPRQPPEFNVSDVTSTVVEPQLSEAVIVYPSATLHST